MQILLQYAHIFIDFILHMDKHLNEWVIAFGPGVYGIFFLIVFCETGLVVTPFLPGDSLLFALGALTAVENAQLSLGLLLMVIIPAALLGDITNYSVGRFVGKRVLQEPFSRWINPEYLKKTQDYYARYGGKTIILARFVPIVRTFAPFVAGVGKMHYFNFIRMSVIGALLWVPTFLTLGHWFGNLPQVKSQFHLVIFAILFISVLPILLEWKRSRK